MKTEADHFSANASGYRRFRPTYPRDLVTYLSGLPAGRKLALDCGCGNGQLTTLLAEHFEHVHGADASAEQIAHAMAHPRVTYSVACAGAIGLRAASVDLVVAAQAAHWFDLTAFFADARRLLKPDGVVALVSYGRIVVEGPCGAPVSHLYSDVLRPFWPAERRHVDNGYRDLEFPFAELKAPCLAIERTWAIDELVGYIRTWSAIEVAARQGHGDVVEAAIEAIRGASGSPSNPISVRWPLATRVGRVDTR